MPASETPTNPPVVNPPEPGFENDPETGSRPESADGGKPSRAYSTSRFVDYDAHELLEKISELEDERRWQRIREGIWISIIAHILFFSALTWIPRYIFHTPQVIDPFDAIKQRKDLTYLDGELPKAIQQLKKIPPPVVDKKTLDTLREIDKARPKPAPSAPVVQRPREPQPAQQQPTPPPTPTLPQPQQTPPPLPSTAAPQPNPQIAMDAPRPAPVPARPNFNLGHQSAADQMRQAARDSAHGSSTVQLPPSHLNMHPGGSTGGLEILSDTQGVNFDNWLIRWHDETQRTWDPLIPEEVNPPISKKGVSVIRFKVQPNGHIMPGSMTLDGRSGDTPLDRAAWGAITGSNYPPLPHDFHGPYLELRAYFLYNVSQ